MRQLLCGTELHAYKSDMASFDNTPLSWLLSIFGIKSSRWTTHAGSKSAVLMGAEQPVCEQGAVCLCGFCSCQPLSMLQSVRSDAARVCYVLFSLSAFPRRTNVHAVICTILDGFCFKMIHGCILLVEREKGKVKELCFAHRWRCSKTCLSFCEIFLTVL